MLKTGALIKLVESRIFRLFLLKKIKLTILKHFSENSQTLTRYNMLSNQKRIFIQIVLEVLIMEKENRTYTYTYSAKQHEEVDSIRKKYLPKEEDKMEQLRKLDQKSTERGKVTAIIMGIISSLVLGIGMCCSMIWTDFFVVGILIGIVGLAGLAFVYPLYINIIAKDRKKLAPQIIALSDELMK